ncbi:MAG: hypothetical protein Q8918_18330 [Bacteroidota bacterium]|nr:hypothetical protein [Bacteroidota bacterium]MDP4252063.1 hypothetical protein [Bacteroidota bacterium]
MRKIFLFVLFLTIVTGAMAQAIGRVDKKTKEFYIASGQKLDYSVFGYKYANNTTQKMICFSSHVTNVKDNYNGCPLGAYFDTGEMKAGDKIVYLGAVGGFGKMSFISGNGRKTIFYLPKSSFTIK